MSKRSEKRSTIFPLPSSPHWDPRMITFPILVKPIHSTVFGSTVAVLGRQWVFNGFGLSTPVEAGRTLLNSCYVARKETPSSPRRRSAQRVRPAGGGDARG